MYQYRFTVFTPTFNRANLLHRVFTSLEEQTFTDFEWLIIDDGSTDNTREVVNKFIKKANFPISYVKKANQGKVSAINDALDIANGELFLVFDSDDWCTKDALLRFNQEWNRIPYNKKEEYAAMSCLKILQNGKLVGDDYSKLEKYGLSYIDRFNRQILGDKWECILTGVHKDNKYDLVGVEKYQAPEYAWLKLARNYKTVFINEAFSIIEYQADGLSYSNMLHRTKSVKSTIKFYALAYEVSNKFKTKFKSLINISRFQLHDNAFWGAIRSSKIIFPLVVLLYFIDKFKLQKINAKNKSLMKN